MPKIDLSTIKTLTQLSRIGCTEEEQKKLFQDLQAILNYVEQLQELNTDNVPPCNQVLKDMANVMRDDSPGKPLSREAFLANAPESIGGLIRVPTVQVKKQAP